MAQTYSDMLSYVFEPYEHQKRGINEITETLMKHGGAPVFVDMGLGKSAIMLHVARILYRKGKINRLLILCPKGIMAVWRREIEKHISNPPPVIQWDTEKSARKWYKKDLQTAFDKTGIVIGIANIESFQSENEQFAGFIGHFCEQDTLCVVDESSTIKTPTAQRTKQLMKRASRFRFRAIMTGTEITNSVLDLYSQFSFVLPGLWQRYGMKNYYEFRARYAVMEKRPYNQGRKVQVVIGYKRVDELMSRVAPYTFRARKEDCFDLPEKIYTTIPVTLNVEQRKAYRELEESMYTEYGDTAISATHAIALLTRFRQITGGYFPESGEAIGASNPKIQVLIDDLKDTSEKAIIWCAFQSEIHGVASVLRSHFGTDHVVTYNGEMSTEERTKAVMAFSNGARFFVANPQVAGFGLNLQFCTLQYFYSRTMRMDENKQAEDRSHRIGTETHCVYKSLVATGTVDQAIHTMIQAKQMLLTGLQTTDIDTIRRILGGEAVDSTAMM